MSKKEFTPVQIGRPDPRREKEITTAYSNMLDAAVSLQMAIEYCLRKDEGFGIDFFFESLKEDTAKFIRRKFVEINEISIPGISTERLKESDLLDIKELDHAIEERKNFDKAWKAVEATRFIYPLRKLYVNDEVGFDLTEDFHQQVQHKIGKFTQNEQQNFILDKMHKLCEILNFFAEIGILFPHKGITEIDILSDFIEVERSNEESPFQVSDILFYKRRMRAFKEKNFFTSNRLTFEDFVAQPEAEQPEVKENT